MRNTRLWILSLVAAFTFMGCTDSPEQYKPSGLQPIDRDNSKIPGSDKSFGKATNPDGGRIDNGEDEETQEERDRKIRENSRKPIIYGKGGGGITLDTLYTDSKKILSKPVYGPSSSGLTDYEEKMWVYWRADEPRTPFQIFFNPGYLGKMDFPEPYGEVRIQQEMKAFFPESDPSGRKFLLDSYNYFEKKPADFNCLDERLCSLNDKEEQFIVFEIPSMIMLFSNDERKTLFRIIIRTNDDPGKMKNDFDMIHGSFLVRNENKEVIETLSFGETWGEILKKNTDKDVVNTLVPTAFVKYFAGLTAVVSKSKSDRKYSTPDPDLEKFVGVGLFDRWTNYLVLDGSYVHVEENLDDGVDLSLMTLPKAETEKFFQMDASQVQLQFGFMNMEPLAADVQLAEAKQLLQAEMAESAEANGVLLQSNMDHLASKAKVQKDLIRKLTILMLEQVKQAPLSKEEGEQVMNGKAGYVPAGKYDLTWRISGLDDQGDFRTFETYILVHDNEKNVNKYMLANIDEGTGDMIFSSELYTDPFYTGAAQQAAKPYSAGSPDLAGFKLGEMVELKSADLGREEITLVKDGMEARAEYDPTGKVKIATNVGGKLKERDLVLHEVKGIGDMDFGFAITENNNGVMKAELNTVTFGHAASGVNNVCGMPKFKITMKVRDTVFHRNLKAAIKKAHEMHKLAADKDKALKKKEKNGEAITPEDQLSEEEKAYLAFAGCKFFIPVDPDGGNLIKTIYFPDQKLKLNFDERELDSMTIYKNIGEAVAGGAQ